MRKPFLNSHIYQIRLSSHQVRANKVRPKSVQVTSGFRLFQSGWRRDFLLLIIFAIFVLLPEQPLKATSLYRIWSFCEPRSLFESSSKCTNNICDTMFSSTLSRWNDMKCWNLVSTSEPEDLVIAFLKLNRLTPLRTPHTVKADLMKFVKTKIVQFCNQQPNEQSCVLLKVQLLNRSKFNMLYVSILAYFQKIYNFVNIFDNLNSHTHNVSVFKAIKIAGCW